MFETRETVEANIQLWKSRRRSDDALRFRLDLLQVNMEIIQRSRDNARQTESIHAHAEYHCKEQGRSRAFSCSMGSV